MTNGYAIDPLKLSAIILVGGGAIFLIYKGEVTPAVALLGAILGYVFGNTHAIITLTGRERAARA